MPATPRTVIIGASGYVGRHLLSAYRAVDPATPGTARQAADGLHFLDLRTPDLGHLHLQEQGCTEAVIAAAAARIDDCERAPLESWSINVTGTMELIRQLWQRDILPIFLSSDYVFDSNCAAGYSDDAPTNPTTQYGLQKAAVERALAASGRPFLVLRLGKVIGVKKGDGTLLDEMAALLAAGRPVRAARDQVFCPVWIGDVVRAIPDIQRRRLRGMINLCSPWPWTRSELAKATARALKCSTELVREISLDELGGIARRPKCTRMIPARMQRETSFSFTRIETCLEWLAREYEHGGTTPQ